jgi:phosphatidylglycerol:prolipoprotein diacylglycerol transferase
MALMPATAAGQGHIHVQIPTAQPGPENNEMEYNAITTRIFNIPPYTFFSVTGVVFAYSLFVLLLLKYCYNIPRYTKIFFLSGIGMLTGAKIFGFLTGLFMTLANKNAITIDAFFNTGIVFYGGMLGFISAFLIICWKLEKKIDYGVVDLAVISIPLYHFFGRLGCFFAGCCFGIENHSIISVLYTNQIDEEIVTVSRFPVQLIEASANIILFIVLYRMSKIKKFEGHLLKIYLIIYAIMRIILEFFRGDLLRGVWNNVSFSQVISVIVLISCAFVIVKELKEGKYEIH